VRFDDYSCILDDHANSLQTVDSLKAVEMRNRVLKEMQSDISVFELLSVTPLTDIAAKIVARSGLVKLDTGKAE
jgi:hypothetical protein